MGGEILDAKERRAKIKDLLSVARQPVTGTALAKELSVSRQVIVGDIAILRAAGVSIYATPEGYLIPGPSDHAEHVAVYACRHGRAELAQELEIIIDNGGKVVDVVVEHPVYGEIRSTLMLASRRQLSEFLQKITDSGAEPLSIVTGGVHLHTVSASSQDVLNRIRDELKVKGILIGD